MPREQTGTKLPRPFAMHWGKGNIVEEARYEGEYHVPCIQILEFEDGSTSVRFCYYSHAGRFQRSPLMVGQETSAGLRDALSETPRLRSLLREIVG